MHLAGSNADCLKLKNNMIHRFISDQHFNHERILEFSHEARGHFKSVNEMNECLISSWNSVVRHDDVTYNLGDFAFGPKSEMPSFFHRLNGRKILIRGNHDKESEKLPWEAVHDYVEYRENNQKVVLFHYPIESWINQHRESLHFHGHVHSNKINPFRYIKNRYDVGCDNIGFVPLTMKEIIDIINHRNK